MSNSREEVLVECLKNVSLQRLRTLKMDMDKLARDSRIGSERAFWSLLEFHNICLDERTRRELRHHIADSRGVNVESAIKHLRRAQRKTGRDSVEVLRKKDSPWPPTGRAVTIVPRSTPITSVAPKITLTPRNYKLDKFRSKAMGIGKLRAALKSNLPGTADVGGVKREDSPRKQNMGKIVTDDADESSPRHGPIKSTNHESIKTRKIETRVKENATEQLGDRESSTREIEESSSNDVTNKVATSGSFLKLILEENSEPKDAEVAKQHNDNKEDNSRSLEPSQGDSDNSKKMREKRGLSEDFKNENKTQQSKVKIKDEKEADDELIDNCLNVSEEMKVEDSIQEEKTDENKEEIPIGDKVACEVEPKEISKYKDGSDGAVEGCSGEEGRDSKTPDEVKMREQREPEGELINKEVDNDRDCDYDETKSVESIESPPVKQDENINDEFAEKTEQTTNQPEINHETQCDSRHDAQSVHPVSRCSNEESTRNSSDEQINEERTDSREKSQPQIKTEEGEESKEEEQGSPQIFKINLDSIDNDSDESEKSVKQSNREKNPNSEIKGTPKNVQTTKSSHKSALEDKNPPHVTSLENNTPALKENVKECPKERKEAEKAELPNFPSEERIPNNIERNSEIFSISTQSSSEDDVTSLDDILRDMSLGAGTTEEIIIGETSIELQAPEGIIDDNQKDKNVPNLHIDWVYGCNTVHSQCMTSLETGELVYYVGCVVIIYDPIRTTQRHYLGHSGEITSVVAHPSERRVASAQFERFRKFPPRKNNPETSRDDRTHVRVWNYVTMETIHVIGAGTVKNAIYRMDFLNVSDYFVTIEHNEECTMTVWDGGCRVTSRSTCFATSQPPIAEKTVKKFVPTLPRSNFRPKNKSARNREDKKSLPLKIINGPKAVSGSLSGELEFAIAGKHHLSFWQVEDDDKNEGIELTGPVNGDFGKNFFRAEFVSTCKASEGSIITGDSNGTLLIWSEKTKLATRGYPHAHECQLSAICTCDDGFIFTAGSKDRLVKAFNARKSRLEACGKIEIPPGVGSATCLALIENNLYVATEKNFIIVVPINTTRSLLSSSTVATKPTAFIEMTPRSLSSSALLVRPAQPHAALNQSTVEERTPSSDCLFSSWEPREVARGFQKLKCAFSLGTLKVKNRHRKVAESRDDVSMPSLDESISIVRKQMSGSAGVRKHLDERNYKITPPTKAIYAWKNVTGSHDNKCDDVNQRKPVIATSSPRLRAHERILSKEKARADDLIKPTPTFALNNHVLTRKLFCDDVTRASSIGDYFVTSSIDGWLLIYGSQEHGILGRCKLSTPGGVVCIDSCSRRHLVAVGTTTGHMTVARINTKNFEVYPPVRCRCSGGGPPDIRRLKFSPSGRKLAVSIGYDVIIMHVRRVVVSEQGRCIGHHSHVIRGLDWSAKKYSGTYFLRTCATQPGLELKTWHSDTMLEVTSRDILTRIQWASASCVLDYRNKGIWDEFSNPGDVTGVAVSNVTSQASPRANDVENKNAIRASGRTLLIGDTSGCVSAQTYPCLMWKDYDVIKRAHSTPIESISILTKQNHVITTSTDDACVVQWSLSRDLH